MANIWTDKRSLTNENSYYSIQNQMNAKQTPGNGSSMIKKQAFGEIKNVMHNQIGATPLKGNAAKIDGLPSAFGLSKSLCNEVLRKQQMNKNFADAQIKMEKKQKYSSFEENYKEPVFDESLFDSWDMDRGCCKQQKSDAEIWSEMRALDLNINGFEYKPSFDEESGKDFLIAPMFIPELDDLPVILDEMNLLGDEKVCGFEYSTAHLPELDYFELPF